MGAATVEAAEGANEGVTPPPGRLARLVAAIDRHADACIVGGLAALALLTWYIAWHVPGSHWLFWSRYDQGFKDLIFRVKDLVAIQHGGTLYSPTDHLQYFVYPPAAAWIFWPLTWSSTYVGSLWWTFLSLACLAGVIAILGRAALGWRWRLAWAVGLLATPVCAVVFPPVAVHLALGQVGLFLLAAATFDLLCVRGRSRGALVGVTAAIKLYPLIYFALFVIRREWRALWTATGSFLAVTALAWLAMPKDSDTFFLHRLTSGKELQHYWHNDHWISSSSSLYTFMFRPPFTGSPPERTIGFVLCLVVLALGVLAAWRQTKEGRPIAAFFSIAIASTVGSPVSWDHNFILVVFVPFLMIERGRLPWWRLGALALLVVTCVLPERVARNESLLHTHVDPLYFVIFAGRNALLFAGLAWIVAALIPWDAQRSRSASSASHALSAS